MQHMIKCFFIWDEILTMILWNLLPTCKSSFGILSKYVHTFSTGDRQFHTNLILRFWWSCHIKCLHLTCKTQNGPFLYQQLRYWLDIWYAAALGIYPTHDKQKDIFSLHCCQAVIKCLRLATKTQNVLISTTS